MHFTAFDFIIDVRGSHHFRLIFSAQLPVYRVAGSQHARATNVECSLAYKIRTSRHILVLELSTPVPGSLPPRVMALPYRTAFLTSRAGDALTAFSLASDKIVCYGGFDSQQTHSGRTAEFYGLRETHSLIHSLIPEEATA